MARGEAFSIRGQNPIPALRHLGEGGMDVRFYDVFARLLQEKTDHFWMKVLQNGDGWSGIGLNGQEECFGRYVGTHNG